MQTVIDIQRDQIKQLETQLQEAEAKVARVRVLPEQWDEYDDSKCSGPMMAVKCANELEAAIAQPETLPSADELIQSQSQSDEIAELDRWIEYIRANHALVAQSADNAMELESRGYVMTPPEKI